MENLEASVAESYRFISMPCHSQISKLVTVGFRVLQFGWREEEIFTLIGIFVVHCNSVVGQPKEI